MRDVRGTIEHLVGVWAASRTSACSRPAADQGVRAQLAARCRVRRIDRITCRRERRAAGRGRSARERRAIDSARLPSANRIDDMVGALHAFYRRRGYAQAADQPRVQEDEPAPEASELVLTIDAGPRLSSAPSTSHGDAARRRGRGRPPCSACSRDAPFDQAALDERIAVYEESLRERGYYEAPRARIARAGRRRHDGRRHASRSRPARTSAWCLPAIRCPKAIATRWCRSAPSARSTRTCSRMPAADRERAARAGLPRRARRRTRATRRAPSWSLTFTIARGPLHRVGIVDVTGVNAQITRRGPGAAAADQGRASRLSRRASADCRSDRPSSIACAASRRSAVKPGSRCCRRHRASAWRFGRCAIRFEHRRRPAHHRQRRDVRGATPRLPRRALQAQMALQRRQAVLPAAAVRRSRRDRTRLPQPGLPERLGASRSWRLPTISSCVGAHLGRFAKAIRSRSIACSITGNSRISTEPHPPRADVPARRSDERRRDAREPAAAGGARPVPPRAHQRAAAHRVAVARDVLVEIEEASADDHRLRRRHRSRPASPPADDWRAARSISSTSARADSSTISRRNLWGKNRSVTLFGRVTLRPREPAIRTDPS